MKYHLSFDISLTHHTYPGKYYAFEGVDGSGKSTQARKLASYFKQKGKKVIITKEPTNGPIGRLIKRVITKKITVPPISLQYLFSADRAVHLQEKVIPHLTSGDIVISDRSMWSAVAYGIADLTRHSDPPAGGEESRERFLVALNVLSVYNGFLVPDKTFFVDVPAKLAVTRMEGRNKTRTLYETEKQLEKVVKEYHFLVEKFDEAIVKIDGTKSKNDVFTNILVYL